MDRRTAQVIAQGSQVFSEYIGVIAPGDSEYHDIWSDWPDSRLFDFLDSIVIVNNSAQPISFLAGSEAYPILPYQVQPISGRPIKMFAIRNDGLAATLANEVHINMRRMPPDVQVVQTVR